MKYRQCKKVYKKLNLHNPEESIILSNGKINMNFRFRVAITQKEKAIAFRMIEFETLIVLLVGALSDLNKLAGNRLFWFWTRCCSIF